MLKKLLLTGLSAFAIAMSALSQTYPIQAHVQLLPPYTPYLGDYVVAGAEKLHVQILLRDLTLMNYRARLRIKIEGVGITIATPSAFTPAPIILQGGAPATLTAFELAPYFAVNNLEFSGLAKSQYIKTGRLPEGLYRFTVEVLDYNRGTVMSNSAVAMAWIVMNDPPFLNVPWNKEKISKVLPQFVVFQWTPRHTASPNAAFSTEYVFRLVEIWPSDRDPNDAILSQRPLYETVVTQTQLVYGPSEPALLPGRYYAWQVTAKDIEKRDLFKNQGKSEVRMFKFGDACEVPTDVHVTRQGLQNLQVVWNGDPMHTQYFVRYRERGQTHWYQTRIIGTQATLSPLNPGKTYEYQVLSSCGMINSDYTDLFTASTLQQTPDQFSCGAASQPEPPINGEPILQMLTPNDELYYQRFKITVTDVTSSSAGKFSGRGIAIIPLLNHANVRVTFQDITVSQGHRVVGGTVESVWNENSPVVVHTPDSDVDDAGKTEPPGVEEPSDKPLETPVVFDGVIESVYVDPVTNDVVVVDSEGNHTIVHQDANSESIGAEEVKVVDQEGNEWVVGTDGSVKQLETPSGVVQDSVEGPLSDSDLLEKIIREIMDEFNSEVKTKIGD